MLKKKYPVQSLFFPYNINNSDSKIKHNVRMFTALFNWVIFKV